MFKDSFITLLTITIIFALSLTACGGGADNADKSELPDASTTTRSENDDKTDPKSPKTKTKGKGNAKTKTDTDTQAKDEDDEDDEVEETSDDEDIEDAQPSEEEVDRFLKYAKELIDDELILPKEIIKTAKQYRDEFAEEKKWRGNYMIVTVNDMGKVTKVKFRTKIPSVENEDINDAFEAAVRKAQPFRDPPVGEKNTFDFKVRLLGTKSYVTKYELKL